MSEPTTHYSNAPIVEAVIDLKFGFVKSPTRTDFQVLLERLKEEFPVQESMEALTIEINRKEHGLDVDKDTGFLGYKLFSKNKNTILQIRKDGFTFSHLYPYTDWDSFKSLAIPLLESYLDLLSPEVITRCAVRYINKIAIKATRIEQEDYFNIYPHVPKLPETPVISQFNMQVRFPQPDIEAEVNITKSLGVPSNIGQLDIILDIDVFSNKRRDPKNLDSLWTYFDKLRKKKNDIFEASITDKTRELIK